MPIVPQVAKPSTLADVIAQVKQAFSLMGDSTPIMVGKQYLKQHGMGNPPRVLFVPEVGAGKLEPPYEMGNAAKMTHTCAVYVRAKESGEDLDRFAKVYALADRVIDCIQTAATGRIVWGSVTDGSPTDTDGAGAEIAFTFSYWRDVWHDPKRWALPPAGTDTSAPVAHPPPGVPDGGTTIVPTTAPEDP